MRSPSSTTIRNQRDQLDTEIEALKAQARELRSLVEQTRQELAREKDELSLNTSMNERAKKQLAELKQAL